MAFLIPHIDSSKIRNNPSIKYVSEDGAYLILKPSGNVSHTIDLMQFNASFGLITIQATSTHATKISFAYSNYPVALPSDIFGYLPKPLFQRIGPISNQNTTSLYFELDKTIELAAQDIVHEQIQFPPCRFITYTLQNMDTENLNTIAFHPLVI
jgi:hypothetical protein